MRLNLEYFNIILPRNNMYAMDTPDSQAVISLGGYYFSAVFLLLFMFMGITGAPIMIRKDRSLYQLMAVRGCGSISQVLSEYGAWCLLMLVFYVIISAGAGILEMFFAGDTGAGWRIMGREAEIFAAMALMIPVLAAMHFFLYQLTGNLIGGVSSWILCVHGSGVFIRMLLSFVIFSGNGPGSVQCPSPGIDHGIYPGSFDRHRGGKQYFRTCGMDAGVFGRSMGDPEPADRP